MTDQPTRYTPASNRELEAIAYVVSTERPRLAIDVDGARLLELCGGSAVLPTMESERALAFAMLSDALALLAGLRPPSGIHGTNPDDGSTRRPIVYPWPDRRPANEGG